MRKLLTGLVTAALVLSLATVGASAHRYHQAALDFVCGGLKIGRVNQENVDRWCGRYFVDEDKDGVCDNYDPEYCPGDGSGNCSGTGIGAGNGAGNGGYQGVHHGGGRGHGRHCG